MAPNRLTVLLPEEHDGWHQLVRQLLAPQGVETLLAGSGREALELIESQRVHLAVLDVRMPQLGGLQVIRLAREHGQSSIPAILLADQLNSHLLHEALGMQVFSVMSKPVDLNVLLDAMARLLKRHYRSKWPV
ncbi:MAG: response regulator [Phycisphaerales bacterium]|nr:response regulator [Phycisphaerales bacterium]